MSIENMEIIEGVKLHLIETDKFKTDLSGILISVPLDRKNITLDCIVPAVLQRGTQNLKTQEEINKKFEENYGTTFNCGIEKTGDNHVIKLYTESINSAFLPNKEDILKKQFDILFDIVFNPLLENGKFLENYVASEKESIRQRIKSKIDNKEEYAVNKCIEKMYEGKPYSLYIFGYEEDLDKIGPEELSNRYREMINTGKIDIFFSRKYQ